MAERLAELANPTPDDVDIEDIADGAKIGGRGEDSEDEYAADDFYSGLVTEVCDERRVSRAAWRHGAGIK